MLTAKQNTPKLRSVTEQFIILQSSVRWLGSAGWFSLGVSHVSLGARAIWRMDGWHVHNGLLTWLAVDGDCRLRVWLRQLRMALQWFRLLMAWQLDSERKHPKNEWFKSPRQKRHGFLRPSPRSPRTALLPHSGGLGIHQDQSIFEERGTGTHLLWGGAGAPAGREGNDGSHLGDHPPPGGACHHCLAVEVPALLWGLED